MFSKVQMVKSKFTPLCELKKQKSSSACTTKKSYVESYRGIIKTNLILFGVIVACISIPSNIFKTENALTVTAAKAFVCVIVINVLLDQPIN